MSKSPVPNSATTSKRRRAARLGLSVVAALTISGFAGADPASAEDPAICGVDEAPSYLLQDDMENANSGNWEFAHTEGTADWTYTPDYSWEDDRTLTAPAPGVASDLTAAMTSSIHVPDVPSNFLSFAHLAQFFDINDAGVVEYSLDRGDSWNDAGPLFVEHGYTSSIGGFGSTSPLAGRMGFTGNAPAGDDDWVVSLLKLPPAEDILFRFRIVTDDVDRGEQPGWLIDDVAAYTCESTVLPTLAVSDLSVTEADSDIPAAFTLTRSGPLTGSSTVAWATLDGSAVAPADYVAVPASSVTFGPGETTKSLPITIKGDNAIEKDEQFAVILADASGAAIEDGNATAILVDDDGPTFVGVDDARIVEGHAGTTPMTFTIRRWGNLTGASSVGWGTDPGTARAPDDFTHVPNTPITFLPGEVAKTVTVSVKGETVPEDTEVMSIRLLGPVGAVIGDTFGIGTIVNDDGVSYLSVGDVTVMEGNSGTTPATFTVTRSGVISGPASVFWSTALGTANGIDIVGVGTTKLEFEPNQPTRTVTVQVKGDTSDESNEMFTVVLQNPVGASISDSAATGIIVDDEGLITPGPSMFVSIDEVSVTEGDLEPASATFTVTRSGDTTGAMALKWYTMTGSATAPEDFVGVPGSSPATLSFSAGETSRTLSLAVIGDIVPEDDEVFYVNLNGQPEGVVLSDSQGKATIVNDDGASSLYVDDVWVLEGDAGTTEAKLTVSRTGNVASPANVRWYTLHGTAQAPGDFVAVPQNTLLSFGANETSKTITVLVNGDILTGPGDAGNEDFMVQLTNASGVSIADDRGTGLIVNDD